MPKFGLASNDAQHLEVYVDGVRRKYAYFADTDEGWVCEYVVEPTDRPGVGKIQQDKDGNPLTETIWGKVEIRNKATGHRRNVQGN
jgi:hypothetical protein